MRAAIVAIGSELLGVDRLDTNSLELTRVLGEYGVDVYCKIVVGDSTSRIAGELRRLSACSDLVLVTGGLGPTADDVTREASAEAFGRTLVMHEDVVTEIERRFVRAGLTMPEVNRRQAMVPAGAQRLPNARGTAPGLLLEEGGCALFFFPGVPHELRGMIESALEPWLRLHTDGTARSQRSLKVSCLAESRVEELIAPAYEEFGREWITVLAKPGEIEIRTTAVGSESERESRLDLMQDRLVQLVGEPVFAVREDQTLEGAVGELLGSRGETVSTAESCTGGLVAQRLTSVPGSSAYFTSAVVAYSNLAKEDLLGVQADLIERCGSVSEEVARSMAEGAVARFDTDYALAVTGVAGPDGGSDSKPVGTVHIALAGRSGSLRHHQGLFPGDRERIRQQSSQWALELLRRRLLGLGFDN